MELFSSTVSKSSSLLSSLSSSFKSISDYKVEEEEEEILDELIDEYWFFENLFHRKQKIFMSTNTDDVWKNIQNQNSLLQIINEKKMKMNQLNDDDDHHNKKFLSATSPIDDVSREEDELTEKAVHEEKDFNRKSSKLVRQSSLSSSKILPKKLQYDSDQFQYYKRHFSDPLYDNSMKNIQEMVFENDHQEKKGARDLAEN